MQRWRKPLIVLIALLGFGALRMPFEAGLSRELREAKLLPEKVSIDTRDRIGQTGSAVALGGLRTLVATFLNLRAFTFYTRDNWTKVAETFDVIVDLAPKTVYYWDSGAWNQYGNAASYYLNRSNLPGLRRREAWRQSIQRGRQFLERGIRNNPDSADLNASLGTLLMSPFKVQAFPSRSQTFLDAADAYQRAIDTGRAKGFTRRSYVYALSRVPGKEGETLAKIRELYDESPKNRAPTLVILMFVLEAHQNPSMDLTKRALELFGTPERAYESLSIHWTRTSEGYPVYGIAETLQSLEKILKIPAEESVFKKTPPPAWNAERYFTD